MGHNLSDISYSGSCTSAEHKHSSFKSFHRGKSLRRCSVSFKTARGLEPIGNNFCKNSPSLRKTGYRPYGESAVKESSFLLQLEQKGLRGIRAGRTITRSGLGSVGAAVSLPSISSYRSLSRKDYCSESTQSDNNSSILARKGVVQPTHGNGNRNQEVTTMEIISYRQGNGVSTSQYQVMQSSRCNSFWTHQGAECSNGLSDQARDLIEASWRHNTESAYSSGWRQWQCWTKLHGVSTSFPSLTDVMNYLSHLFTIGKEYRTISSARSMLSSTLSPINGISIGKNQLICRLMRGIFNKRPPKKTLFPSWSVKKVEKMFSDWSPTDKLPLKQLTLKCAMLVALASAKRASSMCQLSVKQGYFVISESTVIMQPLGLEKTTRPGHKACPIVINALEDQVICPVECIKIYLERTRHLRKNESLFVSMNKPHGSVTAQTICLWLKTIIHLSGQEGTGGSTRSLSSSTLLAKGVTIDDILLTGDWTGAKTFRNHYFKPVPIEEVM